MRDDEMLHISSHGGHLIRPVLYMHTDMYNKERRAGNAHPAVWFVHHQDVGTIIPQGLRCGWQGLVCRIAVRARIRHIESGHGNLSWGWIPLG